MRRPRGRRLMTFRRAAALPRGLREPRPDRATGARHASQAVGHQDLADTLADEEAVLVFGCYHLILRVVVPVRTRIVAEMSQTGRSGKKNVVRGNLKVEEKLERLSVWGRINKQAPRTLGRNIHCRQFR